MLMYNLKLCSIFASVVYANVVAIKRIFKGNSDIFHFGHLGLSTFC